MKSKLFTIMLLLMGCGLGAQVSISLQVPPVGLTIKPQLWNIGLVNTATQPVNIQVDMIMTDIGTGQTVMTAVSPHMFVQPGIKMFTIDDANAITYQAGAGYIIDPGPNGFLPVGVYNICYNLVKWTNDISEHIAEECVTVEVEPLSPPQLVQPGDSDRIYFNRPFFTWLPPMPFSSFSNLHYDWLLVEVQATQTASDAIQQNIPLLIQSNIVFTSFQYPLSMPELDTGKIYAWRVTVKNNSMAIANSEIWSFKIEQNTSDSIRSGKGGYYSPVRREKDASFIICDGVLRYQYIHELNNGNVQVSVKDISHVQHKAVQLDSAYVAVKYGPNYIGMNLGAVSGMVNKHMYLLELVNERDERWFLKFEYRKPEEQ
jgi:hypothetical protein